ncbi:glycosyltransferase [Brevibacillus sp. HB1.1]|uniref:glycosyltransferase n=1 Tax=Brevibacillus sp. HB1.1 TaxID=2738808 RepID=UPI0015774368|nr:glycosyltransferase [Brevibacillus sp. HB1.1]
MKHVLHIVESMGGGVLQYLLQVTRDLSNTRFHHTILYATRDVTPKKLDKLFPEHVNLVYLPMTNKINLINDWRSICDIYKWMKRRTPDIVHLHSSKAGFLGRIASVGISKRKVFYTPHGFSFLMNSENISKRAIYFLAEAVLSYFPGSFIACSKSEYQFSRYFNPFRRKYLVRNSIQLPSTPTAQRCRKRIVAVGRMDEQKNPQLFIRTIRKIRENQPDIEAFWIGDGKLREECVSLSRNIGAQVEFTGWLPHDKVMEYISSASIMLQTSRWEGLPFTMLEAFALGTPVVASDITAHRDIISDGIDGFLARDDVQFAEKSLGILTDTAIANRISEASMLTFQTNYHYGDFIRQLESIYES